MRTSRAQLLAHRKITIQIDDKRLSDCLYFRLASVRMEPVPSVFTAAFDSFVSEEALPLVQLHLEGLVTSDSKFYIPGSDMPRRLVPKLILQFRIR
jgi:hypothetical protein